MAPRVIRHHHRRGLPALLVAVGLACASLALAAGDLTATLRARAVFEAPLTTAAQVHVAVDGVTVRLDGDWSEHSLAPGARSLEVRTPGAALLQRSTDDRWQPVETIAVELRDGETTEIEVVVRPLISVHAPASVEVDGDGRATWSARLSTEYPHALPLSLQALPAAGVEHLAASALRGVIRAGLTPELSFVTSVAPDAEPVELVLQPGDVRTVVAWRHADRAPLAVDPLPAPPSVDHAAHGLGLEVRVAPDVALAGDTVVLEATLRNDGDEAIAYVVTWQLPEWLDAADSAPVAGLLPAGATRRHALDATARFGPPATSLVTAQAETADTTLRAGATLRREQIVLGWDDDATSVAPDHPQRGSVWVENPTDRTLVVRPVIVATGAVTLIDGDATDATPPTHHTSLRDGAWTVPPGHSLHQVGWYGHGLGAGALELTLVGERDVLTHRVRREVSVGGDTAPTRRSNLSIPITLSQSVPTLVLHQPLPTGVRVVPGSARVDGGPLIDPYVDDAGGLWWRLRVDGRDALTLGVELEHAGSLGTLPEPRLAVAVGAQLVPLAGRIDADTVPARLGHAVLGMQAPEPPTSADDVNDADEPATLRVLEPIDGALVRADEAVRVVIDAALGATVELYLDGAPVPPSKLGLHERDTESGRQRLEYYGLALRPGDNHLRVTTADSVIERTVYVAQRPTRIEVSPVQVSADGVTPLVLEVRTLDPRGVPSGFGPLRIEADRQMLDADAFPELRGDHALVRDGVALLRFAPSASAAPIALTLRYDELESRHQVALESVPRLLWNAQGSLGVSIGAAGASLHAAAAAYVESSGEFGDLQFALAGGIDASSEDGVRFTPGLDSVTSDRFPTTGTSATATLPLRSDDGVALRYVGDVISLDYLSGPLQVPGVTHRAEGSAARASISLDDHGRIDLIAGLLPRAQVHIDIVPDGTRRYPLTSTPRLGSERVTLHVLRDGEPIDSLRLRAGQDYVIDTHAPALLLSRALWQRDLDGNELRLEVAYTALDAPREALALGAGWHYHDGPWTLDVGVAQLPSADADVLSVGASASYRAGGLDLGASIERRADEDAGRFRVEARYATPNTSVWSTLELGVRERFDLEGRVRLPELGATLSGRVRVQRDLDPSGFLQADAQLAPDLGLSLRHELADALHLSSATLSTRLAGVDLDAGLRYRWSEGFDALAGLGYAHGGFAVRVDHAQALSLGDSSSRLELRAPVLDATARARLEHVWGGATSGVLGIDQRFADAVNADLELRLPGAGAPAVASATLSAPVRLSERLQLDLHAGLERRMTVDADLQAAFSAGLRYRADTLDAGAAADIAYRAGTTKLVLQADAQWRPDPAHTLAFDASAQLLDEPNGRIDVSYAFHGRDVSVLTYHRASFDPDWTLQGEIASAARLSDRLSLRNAAAYRYQQSDPDALALQHAHGVTLLTEHGVSVGAVAYHALQPLLERHDLALGAELGYALVPGAHIVLGYTVGDGPGLLAGGSPGLHVRVDVFGGTR